MDKQTILRWGERRRRRGTASGEAGGRGLEGGGGEMDGVREMKKEKNAKRGDGM